MGLLSVSTAESYLLLDRATQRFIQKKAEELGCDAMSGVFFGASWFSFCVIEGFQNANNMQQEVP